MSACTQLRMREVVFSPESVFWRVNRETIGLLAGGRALLMQIAHPKVAAGVAEHSHFKQDPLNRLRRTMNTMWSISFNDAATARASLERVTTVHMKVRGHVAANEASCAGERYDAFDPELLLWVHATLIDAGLIAYDNFARPLSSHEAQQYYQESRTLARLFEIPEKLLPDSLADFHAYMNGMLAGNQIVIGPAARSLARDILYPSPWIMKPAGPLFRLITAGLLPARLREAYGLSWNQRREKRFKRAVSAIRAVRPLVPAPLRIVPHARAAERRRRMTRA